MASLGWPLSRRIAGWPLAFGRAELPLLCLLLFGWLTSVVEAGTNCSAADATRNCVNGMVFPIWKPFLDLSVSDRVFRGTIYFFLIAYMFLGVSIVADRFMSSIEVCPSSSPLPFLYCLPFL
jgi:hypothetical protein